MAWSSSSDFLAVIATFAPISPSASAICSPRPREPPVTSATRPERSSSVFTLMGRILVQLESTRGHARDVLRRHRQHGDAGKAARRERRAAARAPYPHDQPGAPRDGGAARGRRGPRLLPQALPHVPLL